MRSFIPARGSGIKIGFPSDPVARRANGPERPRRPRQRLVCWVQAYKYRKGIKHEVGIIRCQLTEDVCYQGQADGRAGG